MNILSSFSYLGEKMVDSRQVGAMSEASPQDSVGVPREKVKRKERDSNSLRQYDICDI
jgi:hypothetical protein